MGGNQKNGPTEKKVDDYAQGVTPERCIKKNRRKRLANIVDCMVATIQNLEDCI